MIDYIVNEDVIKIQKLLLLKKRIKRAVLIISQKRSKKEWRMILYSSHKESLIILISYTEAKGIDPIVCPTLIFQENIKMKILF